MAPGSPSAAAVFLEKRPGLFTPDTLFREYARYLLDSAEAWDLPVSLERIRERHDFRRREAPLPQRGFLLGDAIFINSDDAASVQRFTEAHEMMEALVLALRSERLGHLSPEVRPRFAREKERWCEQGAAELLLPMELFSPLVEKSGITLDAARRLAGLGRISLTAAVRRMLDTDAAPCVFALLKQGHKKSQFVPSRVGQGVLWGEPSDWDPPAELRVWKAWSSPQVSSYVVPNESFARTTLAYQVLQDETLGRIRTSNDRLDLEFIKGRFFVESILVTIQATPVVMVLIHL